MNIHSANGNFTINSLPDQCPFCHRMVTPIPMYGHKYNRLAEVFMYCPNKECYRSFIGYYDMYVNSYNFSGAVSQGFLIGKQFSTTIEDISSSFVTIYNQAYLAEQQSLLEICGVGYRKALEFLIKDYLIRSNPSESESIKGKLLGKCIENHIDDNRIKSVAKRAAWLGNDETHYVKKWEGKDLQDLKKLIELTVHWIEMESLTNSFEEQMPE